MAEEAKAAEEKPAEQEAPAAEVEEEAAAEEQQEQEEKPVVPPGYVPVRALQDERLKRQDAERRLAEAAAAAQPKPAEAAKPREYTDDELDSLEEDARARGDRATIHAVQNYRIDRRAQFLLAQHQQAAQKAQLHTNVTQGLMQSYPSLADAESELFKAAAGEFASLSGEYAAKGFDIASDPHAAELAVSRALRKNPVLVKRSEMAKAKASEAADTHVETEEGGRPKPASSGPKLTSRELDFCRRSGTDPKEYAKFKVQRSARG